MNSGSGSRMGALVLVSVPVWGRDYVRTFTRCAAPALMASVAELGAAVRFLVHTTKADEGAVRAALPGADVEVRYVPPRPTYVVLQEAHSDAVASTPVGDVAILLNADIVVSGNFLSRCLEHVRSGYRAVVLLGIRTAADPSDVPPVGAAPRALLEWAWAHRHQIIRDLEYPGGGSLLPTNLFFSDGASVVARGFHLHPAAVVRGPDTRFRSTIDGDLLDCFPREAVRVVVDPDDCAMLEVSPPNRRFPVRAGSLTPASVALSMRGRASATHCWLVGHRIGVVGEVRDCGDEAVVRDVLELMTRPPPREIRNRRGREPRGRRGVPLTRPGGGRR